MRFSSLRRALLPLCAVLLLSACHSNNASPEHALQGSVDLLKANDFAGFWKHALPPADYQNLRVDWSLQQKNQKPLSAEDQAKFNEMMQKLAAPDAEAQLFAELQPKLEAMQKQYSDQLPVLISFGDAMVKNSVAQNQTLSAAQKAQVTDLMDALVPWAKQTSWFDQAKAKQAVGVVVATARKLDLKDAKHLRSMDFDTAMSKYASGFAGAKQLLAIYGLKLNETLNSVKLSTLSNDDGHAVVKVDYSLLGKPLSSNMNMIEQDGHWYSEDMLNKVRESHKKLAAQAKTTAASPASVGAPAHASPVAAQD